MRLEHQAGPETDALVAEKVMGWRHDLHLSLTHAEDWRLTGRRVAGSDWSPTTDIAAAWEVVKTMDAWDWQLTSHGEGVTMVIYKDEGGFEVMAETASLAICRVALAVVESEASND